MMSKEAMKLAQNVFSMIAIADNLDWVKHQAEQQAAALREALAEQPAQKCSYPYCGCNSKAWCKVERNEALDKKAENARELGLDYEPAQQEPVAYLCENAVGHKYFRWKKPSSTYKPIALYTSPPAQRTWVGLTLEELSEIYNQADWDTVDSWEYERAIEAKLRSKNT